MRERFEVEDVRGAALLVRPVLQRVVAALIERDCTMGELVALTGMSYSLLSHHLRRMVSLGLVREVSRTPRAGRAVARYRATARSYFIPADWCQALPGDQLARRLRESLRTLQRPKGVLLWSEGGPRMRMVPGTARADVTELWLALRLSALAAKQFNEELRELFERWRGQESASGKRYLLHGACSKEEVA